MCLPSTNSNGPPRFEAYMMTGDIIINLAKDISSNTNSSNTSASEFSSLKEPSPSKIPLSIGRRRGRGVIAAAAATEGGGGGGGGGVGVASRIATRIISPTTQANNTSTTSEMDQTESSMSEGYSFFSNLSSGSDTFNVVSNECANESPCNNIVSNNNNINNNNNNNNNKDNHQHVRSYKGLRQQHNSYPSPNHNHNSNHNHNHMASLSWSSSSASSEISYDSTSDSANESTHPANGDTSTNASVNGQITSTPRVPSETTSLTSSTSITTIITTTATTTTTTTPITPTKPSTPTTPTTTYSNSAKHYPNHPHLHHHYNCENKNSKYERPCSPNVNSSRYPSFISPSVKDFENQSDSDMGKSSSYETFHYQYQHQEQQKYQHHNYRYCDDSVASEDINDNGDDNSNQQQEQEQDQQTSNTSKEEKEQCQQQPQQQDQPQQQHQQQQQQSTTPQENQETPSTVLNLNVSSISSSSSTSENESSSEDEMEIPENCHYSPPKSVDRDAASRLAKRLYHLEGFKRSDVCRHLSKNNDFSRIVAEEYLKYFDLKGDTLDGALRKFLTSFCLIGETQERERVLQHFSKRYLDCNPNTLKSTDALHTLTCAIMLLNTDLHGENVGRKMTCNEFIDNLSDLNDGEDFPRDVLVSIYQSIKGEPLQWAFDDDGLSILNGVNSRLGLLGSGSSSSSASSSACASSSSSHNPALLGNNPFLKLPNPNTATEYKRGYIMRKCCFDMNGKRTPFGKRGWKMFYATLRDLVLFLHKDEQGFRKNQLYESLHNSIRIHHALAAPATDYTKKQHVFRLQTADQSEYLFQTSDAQELQSWVDTINLVAGTLSAPSLPSAVGSQSLKKFQKPLLPSSHTKFNTKEQLADHEMRIQRIAQELEEHVSKHPDKGANRRILNEYAEKQSYLEFELKRYSTYASILRTKLHQAFGSGALLEGPSNNKLLSSLSSKSKPLNQLSIGEEQDIDEEKWAEEGHEYQEQVTVKQVSRSHRVSHRKGIR